MLEKFLAELFLGEGASFPNGICTMNINKSLKEIVEGEDITPETVAKILRNQAHMKDWGLNFLLNVQKDLVLSNDVINALF